MKKLFYIILLHLFLSSLIAEWQVRFEKDEETGSSTSYIQSDIVNPVKPMEFPYVGIKSLIQVSNTGSEEYICFAFTEEPVLQNPEVVDNFKLFTAKITWDKKTENVLLFQPEGSNFLFFKDPVSAIKNIESSKKVLIELNWDCEGIVHFEFNIEGSADAIKKMRSRLQ